MATLCLVNQMSGILDSEIQNGGWVVLFKLPGHLASFTSDQLMASQKILRFKEWWPKFVSGTKAGQQDISKVKFWTQQGFTWHGSTAMFEAEGRSLLIKDWNVNFNADASLWRCQC